jgi:hypothetical protein
VRLFLLNFWYKTGNIVGYEYLYPQRGADVGIYPPQTQQRHDSYQAYTTPDHFNPPSYQSSEDSCLSFLKGWYVNFYHMLNKLNVEINSPERNICEQKVFFLLIAKE